MWFSRSLTARPATLEDRPALQTLARYETRVHAHLDWKPVEDWLGRQPFVVAERGSRLVGALACPPDEADTAWLRFFGVVEGVAADKAWDLLWPLGRDGLARIGLRQAAALSLEPWTAPLYAAAGFRNTHSVVVLSRPADAASPPEVPDPALSFRPAEAGDLEAIARVDAAAFQPPWRLSVEMLRLALGQAEYVSVAEQSGDVIGYQLSTPGRHGAHLARLAVCPERQGRGVGRALVRDLIAFYERRGGREITVNTQDDNAASLAVYRRLGFTLTGACFPVYQLDL